MFSILNSAYLIFNFPGAAIYSRGLPARVRSVSFIGNGSNHFSNCRFGIYASHTSLKAIGAGMTAVRQTGIFHERNFRLLTEIRNCTISNASATSGVQQQGIQLTGGAGPLRSLVEGNNISMPNTNVFASGSIAVSAYPSNPYTTTVENNIITMGNNSASRAMGIEVNAAKNTTITGNTIRFGTGLPSLARGISVTASPSCTLSTNNISGLTAQNRDNSGRIAVYSLNCRNYHYECNCVNMTYHGFRFEATNIGTLQTSNIYNHFIGLNIPAGGMIGRQEHKGNRWLGIYISGLGARWDMNPTIARTQQIIYNSGNINHITTNNFNSGVWFLEDNSSSDLNCTNDDCY